MGFAFHYVVSVRMRVGLPNMTQQQMQRFTSAQWSVLRYAANHGPAAKIGGKWLRSCRTLEQRGLLFVWRCTTGCHAIRLTAAGAEALALGVPVRTRNAAARAPKMPPLRSRLVC
jgi:hypothetical protein